MPHIKKKVTILFPILELLTLSMAVLVQNLDHCPRALVMDPVWICLRRSFICVSYAIPFMSFFPLFCSLALSFSQKLADFFAILVFLILPTDLCRQSILGNVFQSNMPLFKRFLCRILNILTFFELLREILTSKHAPKKIQHKEAMMQVGWRYFGFSQGSLSYLNKLKYVTQATVNDYG